MFSAQSFRHSHEFMNNFPDFYRLAQECRIISSDEQIVESINVPAEICHVK